MPITRFVQLHEKITNNQFLMTNHSAYATFVTLILMAEWKSNGTLKRGQCAVSVRDLAKKLGIARTNLQRIMDRLKAEQMITVGHKPGHPKSVVTIVNYSTYQRRHKKARATLRATCRRKSLPSNGSSGPNKDIYPIYPKDAALPLGKGGGSSLEKNGKPTRATEPPPATPQTPPDRLRSLGYDEPEIEELLNDKPKRRRF